MHELGATRDNSPFLFNLATLTSGSRSLCGQCAGVWLRGTMKNLLILGESCGTDL